MFRKPIIASIVALLATVLVSCSLGKNLKPASEAAPGTVKFIILQMNDIY